MRAHRFTLIGVSASQTSLVPLPYCELDIPELQGLLLSTKRRLCQHSEVHAAALHNPERLLEGTTNTKIARYRQAYAQRHFVLLLCILSTSGRIRGEFLRLLSTSSPIVAKLDISRGSAITSPVPRPAHGVSPFSSPSIGRPSAWLQREPPPAVRTRHAYCRIQPARPPAPSEPTSIFLQTHHHNG